MPTFRYGIPQARTTPPPRQPGLGVSASAYVPQLNPALGALGTGARTLFNYGPRTAVQGLASRFPQFNYGTPAPAPMAAPIAPAAPALSGVPSVQYGTPPVQGQEQGQGYNVMRQQYQAANAGQGRFTYGTPPPPTTPRYGDWRDEAARWAEQHGGNPQDMINRVVNVYMNKEDPYAADNPYSALANAQSDDIWAQAASMAFGRPPNEVEWKEHYYAKNYGSRDPLVGHGEAIQWIQQQAEQMRQESVQRAQEQAQQYLNQGNTYTGE